ncbi:hypothetical protein OSB04_031611 [Centaurea solstitialis]|uniref:Uncharacterized protein n=1 Tax=Centaurea solstitialis TaxID=347529 RepID=A0AA38SHC6_9ASTR|nr:hypothetical protein OSB04_031611 [Centaurea solstitialis]
MFLRGLQSDIRNWVRALHPATLIRQWISLVPLQQLQPFMETNPICIGLRLGILGYDSLHSMVGDLRRHHIQLADPTNAILGAWNSNPIARGLSFLLQPIVARRTIMLVFCSNEGDYCLSDDQQTQLDAVLLQFSSLFQSPQGLPSI